MPDLIKTGLSLWRLFGAGATNTLRGILFAITLFGYGSFRQELGTISFQITCGHRHIGFATFDTDTRGIDGRATFFMIDFLIVFLPFMRAPFLS